MTFNRPLSRAPWRGGFTLAEMMVSVTLFGLLLGALVYGNLLGLKMYEAAKYKLDASRNARKAIGRMEDEMRGSKRTLVGNYTNGTFVAVTPGKTQAGNALLIYPTTNQAQFIVYFLNSGDQSLRRTTSQPNTTQILAQCITNQVVFRAQDARGNVLTNNQNNQTFFVSLRCFQPRLTTLADDHYTLETCVTRRSFD